MIRSFACSFNPPGSLKDFFLLVQILIKTSINLNDGEMVPRRSLLVTKINSKWEKYKKIQICSILEWFLQPINMEINFFSCVRTN